MDQNLSKRTWTPAAVTIPFPGSTKTPTRIEGFDQVTGGGLPRGRTTRLGIFMTPALIRVAPSPARRIVGTWAGRDRPQRPRAVAAPGMKRGIATMPESAHDEIVAPVATLQHAERRLEELTAGKAQVA